MLMAMFSQLIINYKILESSDKKDYPDDDYAVYYLPSPNSRNKMMDVLTYGVLLTMGMSLLVSLFIIFPIEERRTGAKHLQMMTGLHPVIYWISNLTWDYLIYLASSALMLILLMAMDHDKTFTSFQAPGKFRVQHEL